MADVFISYSRKDIEFAQRIHHELEARDREPWVDWQDIPPTSEWVDEVYAVIQATDTFLFVISPDSVVSEICALEIEHAVKHNKRLVPVVLRDVEDDQVHSVISAHNWVFLREEDDFEANFELLIDALDTDLEYVKEHTRLLTRAIEWDENNRARGLALSKRELRVADRWFMQGLSTEPKPTDLHCEYLDFSRTVVDRLKILVILSVTLAFVLVLGYELFAFYKYIYNDGFYVTYSPNGQRVVTASEDYATKVCNAQSGKELLTIIGHEKGVVSAVCNPDGARIVTASFEKTAKVWDATTGEELFTHSKRVV